MTESTPVHYPLRNLYFYLTEGCNLACRHCWLAPKFDPGASRYPTLPVETFEAVHLRGPAARTTRGQADRRRAVDAPPHPRPAGNCAPGGPAVDSRNQRPVVHGCLAAEIARGKVIQVSVSLDGVDAATHEWVRNVAGSFEAAAQAVRNLAAAGLSTQVIFSIMRHNAHQVEAAARLAASSGAASIKYNIVQPTARGEMLHQADEVLSIAELVQLGRFIEYDLAKRMPIDIWFSHPMAFRPLSRIVQDGENSACGILSILGVLATGQYALCGIGENIAELVFGQAGKGLLAQLWHEHPILQALRQNLPGQLSGVCADCLMKNACLGECIAQNYYRSASLWAPFWFCEAAEAQGLFPASRLAR